MLQEREEAARLFGAPVRKAKAHSKRKQAAPAAKTFVPGEPAPTAAAHVPVKPAVVSQLALKVSSCFTFIFVRELIVRQAAVENAKTLDEVERIERAMTTGGLVPAARPVDADMLEADS